MPCDSSSGDDDGEDTVATHKAALAKEKELQETKQQVKKMERQSQSVEASVTASTLMKNKQQGSPVEKDGGRGARQQDGGCEKEGTHWREKGVGSAHSHRRSKLHLWRTCSAGPESVKEEGRTCCQSTTLQNWPNKVQTLRDKQTRRT